MTKLPVPAPATGGAKSIPEACAYLGGIGKSKLYEMMAANEIPSVKIGGRRVLLVADLDAYLAKLAKGE